ncbi:MAG: nicotinate (nicotinamide) nucleotide adenylyltransferase [Chitinophagaceae bacterium]
MKIGLYFGSFNPIHTGHLIIANHVANTNLVQQVWMVVSPQNPLKPSKSLLNEYHRLHLAQLATANNSLLKVSDVEFKLPKPSFTIDTLTYLVEKYPKYEFSIIVGSDSFQNLPRWKNYELLLKQFAFLVYERPNFPVTEFKEALSITTLQAPLLEISATYIRENIREGKSIQYIVPDLVAKEIEDNGYYK